MSTGARDRYEARKAREKYRAEHPGDTPEASNRRARLKYEASRLAKKTRLLYRQSPAGKEAARRASQAYRDRKRAARLTGRRILPDGTIQAL